MLFLKHYGVVLKNTNRILFTEGAWRTLYHFKAEIFVCFSNLPKRIQPVENYKVL